MEAGMERKDECAESEGLEAKATEAAAAAAEVTAQAAAGGGMRRQAAAGGGRRKLAGGCLCNGAAIMLQLIEQACSCSTV